MPLPPTQPPSPLPIDLYWLFYVVCLFFCLRCWTVFPGSTRGSVCNARASRSRPSLETGCPNQRLVWRWHFNKSVLWWLVMKAQHRYSHVLCVDVMKAQHRYSHVLCVDVMKAQHRYSHVLCVDVMKAEHRYSHVLCVDGTRLLWIASVGKGFLFVSAGAKGLKSPSGKSETHWVAVVFLFFLGGGGGWGRGFYFESVLILQRLLKAYGFLRPLTWYYVCGALEKLKNVECPFMFCDLQTGRTVSACVGLASAVQTLEQMHGKSKLNTTCLGG